MTLLLRRQAPSPPSPALAMPPMYQAPAPGRLLAGSVPDFSQWLAGGSFGASCPTHFISVSTPALCSPATRCALCTARLHKHTRCDTSEGVGKGPGSHLQSSDEQRKGRRLMGSFCQPSRLQQSTSHAHPQEPEWCSWAEAQAQVKSQPFQKVLSLSSWQGLIYAMSSSPSLPYLRETVQGSFETKTAPKTTLLGENSLNSVRIKNGG